MGDVHDGKRQNRGKAATLAVRFKHRLETDLEFRERMGQYAESVASGIQQWHAQIDAVAARFVSGVEAFQENLALTVDQVEPMLQGLIKSFRLLPAAFRQAVITLAEEGWFISPDMSLTEPSEAAALFMKGEREQGNQRLAMYFESSVDEIERTLTEALPRRAVLISAAFAAHRRGEYVLAIPVFFAQTDGVCFDLANGSLFQTERPKKGVPIRPATADFVDAFESDMFWRIFLRPLGQKIPINFSKGERGEGFEGLNRHMVMHGESLEYGTKINSLKCISLLSYAAWVLKESRERIPVTLPSGPGSS